MKPVITPEQLIELRRIIEANFNGKIVIRKSGRRGAISLIEDALNTLCPSEL